MTTVRVTANTIAEHVPCVRCCTSDDTTRDGLLAMLESIATGETTTLTQALRVLDKALRDMSIWEQENAMTSTPATNR